MRCLTLWQPWASLIAVGAKTIETRSWPTKYRGQLAIHAARRRPPIHWHRPDDDLPPAIDLYAMARYWEWTEGDDYYGSYRWTGPLGAIVATAQLVDCVPIVEYDSDEPVPGAGWFIERDGDRIWLNTSGPNTWEYDSTSIADQVPYCDFRPGRWAWLLDDVQPTTERCPMGCQIVALDGEDDHDAVRGGHRVQTGSVPVGGGILTSWTTCPVCNGAGRCDPIPAKGHQSLWEWTP